MQSVASEIYALQDEQRFTREKQHNYKDGILMKSSIQKKGIGWITKILNM